MLVQSASEGAKVRCVSHSILAVDLHIQHRDVSTSTTSGLEQNVGTSVHGSPLDTTADFITSR